MTRFPRNGADRPGLVTRWARDGQDAGRRGRGRLTVRFTSEVPAGSISIHPLALPRSPPVTSQQTPPRTTTWDNPFLEPPRSTLRVVAAIVAMIVLALGVASALYLSV